MESQVNKQIALNSFFKSKIEYYVMELEKYETENLRLKEFIYNFENNQNSSTGIRFKFLKIPLYSFIGYFIKIFSKKCYYAKFIK